MARKRAVLKPDDTRRVLGEDLVDRFLDAEGFREVDVVEIPLSEIDPNPFQPRRDFDTPGLEELAQSVQNHGFYGHLVARPMGDKYQIAYGERRKQAAERAGLTHLPLAIRPLSDEQMLEIALTENIQRKDLNPVEEAQAYQRLTGLGYSLRQISERVGKSHGHISLLLSLLRYEDVEIAVREGQLGVREGHEIAKVEDEDIRDRLTDQYRRRELDRASLREAVRLAVEKEDTSAPDSDQPSSLPLETFDPRPHLNSAWKQLEKISSQPLAEMEEPIRADVQVSLQKMVSRLCILLEQIQKEPSS